MLTLGVSTSSGQFALVLGENDQIIFHSDELKLSNNQDIGVLISKGLEYTQKSIHDIANIVVDVGPGGTSRVRTGVAFANSLAYSLKIGICPVSSMELAGRFAWETYTCPVISTVNSINGNAYIGFFNHNQLISIEYGQINELIPPLVQNIEEEIVVVGYHRQLISQLLTDKKVLDSGHLFGNAKILVEKSSLFLDRAVHFPAFAQPIIEKTLRSE